ncbi:endonuclease/exonuclease/phosphatase family protein [Hellea sp.]|nr:endonuclease/exonuclease/phosphatase family protein [Hellea sp.]
MLCLTTGCASSGKAVPAPQSENSVRIATFNIHYLRVNEKGLKGWDKQKGAVAAMIGELNPDILAFQEMESFGGGHSRNENIQLDFVLENYPVYAAAAYSENAGTYPITQPIIYKADMFDFVDQGFFFYSDTPDQIYSRTYNGSFPAFTSWATLKDKASGKVFTVFNMHTDYASKSNRVKSAELMAARISPRVSNGESVFLVGDLNGHIKSKEADLLKTTPLTFVPPKGSTFHFNRGINLTRAIDHIFYTDDITLESGVIVVRKKYDGEWPGDHYPVAADFSFADK